MPDLAQIAPIAELLLQLSSLLSGVSTSRAEPKLSGWSIREWSEWGQKKSAIASATAKSNGEMKRRISELEAELAHTRPVDLSTDSATIAHDLKDDPLSKYDPWGGSLYPAQVQQPSSNISDVWSCWKSLHRCAGGSDLQRVASKQWAWDVTPFVEVDEPSMIFHRTEQKECIKGDWRSVPASFWQPLHSKFVGLNDQNELTKVTKNNHEEQEILDELPRAELKPAWSHIRRYSPSASLPASTEHALKENGVQDCELGKLRKTLLYAMKEQLLTVCPYSYQLQPESGSVRAALLPVSLR